jgi:hypothetical protein
MHICVSSNHSFIIPLSVYFKLYVGLLPPITLIVTTPQASILMAFEAHLNHRNCNENYKIYKKNEEVSLRLEELSDITGLVDEELQYILKSLCDSSLPLIERSPDGMNYMLSSLLRSGALGGIYIYICMYMYIFIYIHICICIYIYRYIYIFMYIQKCVFIYA